MAKRGKRSKKNRNRNKFKNKETKMTVVKNTTLVTIYGNMRIDGKDNKSLPESAKLVGIFYSEPIYKLKKQLGDAALFEKGNTSVLFEVYEIDEKDLNLIDTQLGYYEEYEDEDATKDYNYYLRRTVDTPYGKAFIYFYNDLHYETSKHPNIISGDWIEFLKEEEFQKQV